MRRNSNQKQSFRTSFYAIYDTDSKEYLVDFSQSSGGAYHDMHWAALFNDVSPKRFGETARFKTMQDAEAALRVVREEYDLHPPDLFQIHKIDLR
jgi:hypothetical protein